MLKLKIKFNNVNQTKFQKRFFNKCPFLIDCKNKNRGVVPPCSKETKNVRN